MKIFIISLVSATERREFQLQQAAKLGLKIDFVDAVSIDDISEKDKVQMSKNWTRSVRDLDLAIFMSHKKVWQLAMGLAEPCLILEDDAILSKNIKLFLDYINQDSYDPNVVLDLEYVPRKHILSVKKIKFNNWDFSYIYQNKNGLACYLITPKIAKKMLKATDCFQLIDCFFWSRNFIKPYQVEPALAVQSIFLNGCKLQDHKFDFVAGSSFLLSRLIRLKLTLYTLPKFILGIFLGNKRYIKFNKNDFKY